MINIFTDFDGTVTRRDVGDLMFETFGGERCRTIVQEYREERLPAAECFRRECEACAAVSEAELDAFLDRQEIDETFVAFVRYCRSRGFACYVLSDGMDYYIGRILRRCALGDLPVYSNTLRFAPAGEHGRVRFSPEFPYADEVCDRCACCKRNHLLTLSGDDDIIVYIGEGYSDRCPARFADVIFAKDELLRYCRAENISCYEYRTFADIQDRLERLANNRRAGGSAAGLRKRRQAERARRDLFVGE
jgi:2-hydroxy-3-keto-5-methylthiopentenyl-1-phosphate phosphatase